MGKSERRKGLRGMNDACAQWLKHGFAMLVNPQWRGGRGQPDIVPDKLRMKWADAVALDEMLHGEIKRCERTSIDAWMHQAMSDAAHRTPYVMHRRSHEPWKVTMLFDDWIGLVREALPVSEKAPDDDGRDAP